MKVQSIARQGMFEEVSSYCGTVTELGEAGLIIDGVTHAERALSCLVEVEVDDQVLYCMAANRGYVLAVLSGKREQEAVLSLPGREAVTIHSRKLGVLGEESLTLQSHGDIAVQTPRTLELTARDCFTTVCNSLIQLAGQQINRARQISLEAKELLRTHGYHQVITAKEDVKIDAERITMG